MSEPRVLRYAAFASSPDGGNPAGVVLDARGLSPETMQRIAAEVDDAETAVVTGTTDAGARAIRYFSPIAEVPFCGHATIATAVALAEHGDALGPLPTTIRFSTPVGEIPITVTHEPDGLRAAFTSRAPVVTPLPQADLDAILDLIGLAADDLDADLPPRIADAGNPHPLLVIADREVFDRFTFDPVAARTLMDARGWPATITVVHRVGDAAFSARNIFPVGRITEDPATGSAAAALGGYLRELGAVPVPSRVEVHQGAHVGRPGLLSVDIPASGGIIVSGTAVPIP
ncbi:PhzF family phenazine biosynthesis protein [Microbacterium sp. NPDC077184]|uniref:PhzF family phenazine biosynthesis protein n=1 Tax=Microbacterium sp. NPDC077184 TaxID=3154764 RepID=UPI00343D7095